MIQDNLKILIVEDNPNDTRLIEYHIGKIVANPEIVSVDTFDGFVDALDLFNPDIILSDYRMSGFTGMEVLKYTNENSDVSDFIFITGTIYDEELAAQTILSGATGYILKKNINILHEKLLPYFEKLVLKRQTSMPSGQEDMLSKIQAFVERASKDNQTHIESYLQIKHAIDKIKANKN